MRVSSADEISLRSRAARARSNFSGRSRLPTWSARDGGSVRADKARVPFALLRWRMQLVPLVDDVGVRVDRLVDEDAVGLLDLRDIDVLDRLARRRIDLGGPARAVPRKALDRCQHLVAVTLPARRLQ